MVSKLDLFCHVLYLDITLGEFPLVLLTYNALCNKTDRRARLDASLQHAVCSEVPFFCSNFNSKRSSNSTNLIVHMATFYSNAAMCSLV
jgi:hypothetical protein